MAQEVRRRTEEACGQEGMRGAVRSGSKWAGGWGGASQAVEAGGQKRWQAEAAAVVEVKRGGGT